ncbi:MAG TPA: DUF3368 domain-containing protein [Verrucomicrobiae bacterium]
MIVVSDSSSISGLIRIDHSELLQQLYGEILIPEAVRHELQDFFPRLPEFIHTQKVLNFAKVNQLCADLDLGEAEAIVLAKEVHAEILLIDELDGRRIARREGIPIIGLMGVLLQAKNQRLIPSVKPVIERLENEVDFRLSAELKRMTIQQANEL